MDVNNRKNSRFIVLGVGIVFVLIIALQFFSMQNPSPYEQAIKQHRAQLDLQFKNSADSPIAEAQREQFESLRHYMVDENYHLEADLVPSQERDTVILLTTTGADRPMLKVGTLQFQLSGKTHKLTAFQYLDAPREDWFVPFKDLTSGISTYGGGRYLDVPQSKSPVTIDFNYAYNPYCAYNEEYSCPVPPLENRLKIEIRAGELDYQPNP